MSSKFEQYLMQDLMGGDVEKLFQPWDMDKVWRDVHKWKIPTRLLYVYVIANRCNFRTRHAWVGCNSDVNKRILQHNGLVSGGSVDTRKAAGHWKMMMYVVIPPYRNYSTKRIKQQCKRGRGWASRCKKVVTMAVSKGLEFKISKCILDKKSPYYAPGVADMLNKFTSESERRQVLMD
jgi:hypothetical protein